MEDLSLYLCNAVRSSPVTHYLLQQQVLRLYTQRKLLNTRYKGANIMAKALATHEMLEVHELLIFKTSCVTKAMAMRELVKDDDLRKIIDEDIQESTKAIEDLRSILEKQQ